MGLPFRLFTAVLLLTTDCVLAATVESLLQSRSTTPAQLIQTAQHYEHGEGVTQNIDTAVRLYCRAARGGDPQAQYRLGWIYANARHLPRDEATAAAWFQKAAAQGDAYAARMLRRLAAPTAQAHCVLSDGERILEPLRSQPNPSPELILHWVKRLAPEYGLDTSLVIAVIRAESNFNPKALSSRNARGLMQLIPATAKRFDVHNVWDPLENIRGGMAYLRWLLAHFADNEKLALAGYNAGENAVVRYRGIPPYAETRNYVRKVSGWRNIPPARLLKKG